MADRAEIAARKAAACQMRKRGGSARIVSTMALKRITLRRAPNRPARSFRPTTPSLALAAPGNNVRDQPWLWSKAASASQNLRLERAAAAKGEGGRSSRIRTYDPHVPNVVLYQTELYSDT